MTFLSESFYIGIDVSKHKLDICVLPEQYYFSVTNDKLGIRQLLRQLKQRHGLVCMEATSCYHRSAQLALQQAGFPVAICNPKNIHYFIKSQSIKAKTDKLDSLLIAQYAQQHHPRPSIIMNKKILKNKAIYARIKQLKIMIAAEKNHLESTTEMISKHIKKSILFMEKQITDLKSKILDSINQDPNQKQIYDLVISMKGVGKESAMAICMELPEIGLISRKQIASLVGCAPFNKESGKMFKRRSIRGGRFNLRQILYMASMVAVRHNPRIRAFYEKLLSKGKEKKVALIACMHKMLTILNARVAELYQQIDGSLTEIQDS